MISEIPGLMETMKLRAARVPADSGYVTTSVHDEGYETETAIANEK